MILNIVIVLTYIIYFSFKLKGLFFFLRALKNKAHARPLYFKFFREFPVAGIFHGIKHQFMAIDEESRESQMAGASEALTFLLFFNIFVHELLIASLNTVNSINEKAKYLR